jgi:hypothetical protein
VESWRLMFGLAAAPALVLGAGILGCPESPAWLARQGRSTEAAEVAEKLWGPAGGSGGGPRGSPLCLSRAARLPGPERTRPLALPRCCPACTPQPPHSGLPTPHLPPPPALAGASQLEAPAGDVESKGAPGQAGGAPSKGASRAFYIGILLFFFQQFSGINALVYFSTSVFRCARRGRAGRLRRPLAAAEECGA